MNASVGKGAGRGLPYNLITSLYLVKSSFIFVSLGLLVDRNVGSFQLADAALPSLSQISGSTFRRGRLPPIFCIPLVLSYCGIVILLYSSGGECVVKSTINH